MLNYYINKYQLSISFSSAMTVISFIENHPMLQFLLLQLLIILIDIVKYKFLKKSTKTRLVQRDKSFEVEQKDE